MKPTSSSPKSSSRAVDGAAIFEKRSQGRDLSDDLERATMEMLYRHQIEFVVGHGVGVHAEVSKESPERATLVRTEGCSDPRSPHHHAAHGSRC